MPRQRVRNKADLTRHRLKSRLLRLPKRARLQGDSFVHGPVAQTASPLRVLGAEMASQLNSEDPMTRREIADVFKSVLGKGGNARSGALGLSSFSGWRLQGAAFRSTRSSNLVLSHVSSSSCNATTILYCRFLHSSPCLNARGSRSLCYPPRCAPHRHTSEPHSVIVDLRPGSLVSQFPQRCLVSQCWFCG